MADEWPSAPIHTLLYNKEAMGSAFAHRDVRPSPLQRLGVGQDGFRRLLPILPAAASRLPVQEHDVVISSSSAFAHGVHARPDATHVCYCYTPFRYAWYEREAGLALVPSKARPLAGYTLDRIREWDLRAAERTTRYVAISRLSQERIARYWNRTAEIVYPPVEVDRFSVGEPEDFFLLVSELVPHKRVQVALEAAKRAGVPLKVVGGGVDLPRLRALYGGTADFVGRTDDAQLADLYRRCRALVMPGVEEFGITAVEAQASGRPVIGVDAGGAQETVIDGLTGVLIPGDVESFADAMREVDTAKFQPAAAVANAARFAPSHFREGLRRQVALATGAVTVVPEVDALPSAGPFIASANSRRPASADAHRLSSR